MSIEYCEITDPALIPECIDIQKDIFNLSEIDSFPAAYFNMLIRKEHPLGLIVGCFKTISNTRKLIGIGVAMADKPDNSAYVPFIGILPDYHNTRYGYSLLLFLRKIALVHGFNTIYAMYNPLEVNLGKLYTTVGMIMTQYIPEPYRLRSERQASLDKVFTVWNIDSDHVKKKIGREDSLNFHESINKYPIAENTLLEENKILIEAPNNFKQIKTEDPEKAAQWQDLFRTLLNEYINTKGYIITDCISGKQEKLKKSYYLLSKSA